MYRGKSRPDVLNRTLQYVNRNHIDEPLLLCSCEIAPYQGYFTYDEEVENVEFVCFGCDRRATIGIATVGSLYAKYGDPIDTSRKATQHDRITAANDG